MQEKSRAARLFAAVLVLVLLAGCGRDVPDGKKVRPTPVAPSNAQQLFCPEEVANPAYLLTIPGKNSKILNHKCTEKECTEYLFSREPTAGESR